MDDRRGNVWEEIDLVESSEAFLLFNAFVIAMMSDSPQLPITRSWAK
tara:strand:- start:198 stop:338 length:141 start_codon:yes stop_codon:yes gene_type:complete